MARMACKKKKKKMYECVIVCVSFADNNVIIIGQTETLLLVLNISMNIQNE